MLPILKRAVLLGRDLTVEYSQLCPKNPHKTASEGCPLLRAGQTPVAHAQSEFVPHGLKIVTQASKELQVQQLKKQVHCICDMITKLTACLEAYRSRMGYKCLNFDADRCTLCVSLSWLRLEDAAWIFAVGLLLVF